MPKIVVLDPLSDDGLNLLKAAANIDYEERTGLKGDDLRKTLNEFEGAICRSGVKITAEILEGNTRLRAIARAGVGVDNIDTAAASKHGIVVMNTPGGNTISTAEQAWTLLMGLSRNLYSAYDSLVEGRWDRKKFMGSQVSGKVLGIVGMGRIGQTVARFARAFEMKIYAFDPFLTTEKAQEYGVTMVSGFHEMLPLVDYLTVHTPLTDSTRGMFGRKELELIKKGARLINCARGGIFDLDVLVEGMESGKLGGVALDVYESEPCTNHPLFGKPNVICTPHLGASTEEAQTNVAVEAAELLIDYFTTGTIRQAVNFSPLDAETLHGLRGYLNVTYRLGLLSSKMTKGTPLTCKMKYKGEVCKKDTSLLSVAFAAGLLTGSMDGEVNIVSAGAVLKERGIRMIEEKTDEIGDFGSLITSELTTELGTLSLSGTLFGSSMPRLVLKDGSRLESYLDGTLFIFNHRDLPGVIGAVGNIFGKHRVNIAHMTVGRETQEPGSEAVGVLSLDSVPPAEAIKEILSLEYVSNAWCVNLPAAGSAPSWMN
ncbi:MAG: phosphoglycerate dehydrogenase [Planctomycetaceae bacterium]|jgi:D-3-phosphoglycerate dehydrogenase|nr:phosphoglycerate dehydrogenase [Planctomycetaceae bacterium]